MNPAVESYRELIKQTLDTIFTLEAKLESRVRPLNSLEIRGWKKIRQDYKDRFDEIMECFEHLLSNIEISPGSVIELIDREAAIQQALAGIIIETKALKEIWRESDPMSLLDYELFEGFDEKREALEMASDISNTIVRLRADIELKEGSEDEAALGEYLKSATLDVESTSRVFEFRSLSEVERFKGLLMLFELPVDGDWEGWYEVEDAIADLATFEKNVDDTHKPPPEDDGSSRYKRHEFYGTPYIAY